MSYTSALLTHTGGITTEEWDRLYADSLISMENGSTPWNIYVSDFSPENKKNFMWESVAHAVDAPNTFCFTTSLDNHMVQLILGTKVGTQANLYFALYGKNANGSKSWLYDDDYHAHCKSFFAENNALTLEAKSVKGGPMDDFVNKKALTNYSGFSESNERLPETTTLGTSSLRKVSSALT